MCTSASSGAEPAQCGVEEGVEEGASIGSHAMRRLTGGGTATAMAACFPPTDPPAEPLPTPLPPVPRGVEAEEDPAALSLLEPHTATRPGRSREYRCVEWWAVVTASTVPSGEKARPVTKAWVRPRSSFHTSCAPSGPRAGPGRAALSALALRLRSTATWYLFESPQG